MRNSKSQSSNAKETPTSKAQAGSLVDGWDVICPTIADGGAAWELKDDLAVGARQPPFDLRERTALFGENIIRFAKKVPRDPMNDRLIGQVVGAGTSVGANFCEASDSVSKKDFRHSAKRCLKEAKETRFFLRMIAASEPALADEARVLYREATEIIRILGSMCRK